MDWTAVPSQDISLDCDIAIRRFCPARIEEEHREWEEIFQEIDMSSPTDTTNSPCLDNSEIDEFIESFINMENYNDDGDKEESQTGLDCFQDESNNAEIMDSSMVQDFDLDQGLHLVHMLLACAEALSCRDAQLAESMLSQIWALVSPYGDSLQRVSYCFAVGLKSRLLLLHNANTNGTFMSGGSSTEVTREERMEAFQILNQTTPFVDFGFMVANEAICQTATGKEYIHIIDLGMEHTLQWNSLIKTLASRPEGPPKHLRITGLVDDHKSLSLDLEASMNMLVEEASSLGIPLHLKMLSEPVTPSILTIEKLDLREGESLFINSFTHLHCFVKESRGSLKEILLALKKLSPALLTLVEQDANHNGPFFLGRFLESLHYYSAVFDSLEAILPRNSPQRMKIERLHFAEEIRNIVACEGSSRIERHERADQWRRQLGRAGFQVMGLNCMSQAQMLLSVYGCDGYTLASEKGCLLLGWKGRSILLASAWQVHNLPSS